VCGIETGQYTEAMRSFDDARAAAEAAREEALVALLDVELGRGLILLGDPSTRGGRMTTLLPWAEAWLGIAHAETGTSRVPTCTATTSE
jgi:hypothetical protein